MAVAPALIVSAAGSPGPMVVPADKLRSVLGIRSVVFTQSKETLAVTDQTLAAS